jgi:hypothetical protein
MSKVDKIHKELFKNINSFINEIELSFEYITSNTINKINKYVKTIQNNETEFDNFIEKTHTHLHFFESKLHKITLDKTVKTSEYSFINDIHLFEPEQNVSLLNLSVFNNENKNTKKSLIKYVYNIYLCCTFLINIQNKNDTILNEYIDKITQKEIEEKIDEVIIPQFNQQNQSEIQLPQLDMNMLNNLNLGNLSDVSQLGNLGNLSQLGNLGNLGNLGGIENLMSSLMNNTDIMNIANEISNEMKTSTLNPMDLMSGLMSGNLENSEFSNLMTKIQNSVDSKINNGEINKEQLENQAKDIFDKVKESPELLNIPGMSNIFQNYKQ